MKEEDDTAIVICATIADMPVPPLAGALRGVCADCSTPLWMAPSTRALLARLGGKALCRACTHDRAEGSDNVEVMPPTPEQQTEIREALGPDLN